MATYFHSAPLMLAPGSVIAPGNWGRILNAYRQNAGNAWLLAREFVFESVRASEFPSLPSRLSCAFVFERLEDVNKYQNEFTRWNSIYQVELVEPGASYHRAGFNHVQFPDANTEFVPVAAKLARQYWGAENIQVPEILTKSSLRVEKMVSSGPGTYQP